MESRGAGINAKGREQKPLSIRGLKWERQRWACDEGCTAFIRSWQAARPHQEAIRKLQPPRPQVGRRNSPAAREGLTVCPDRHRFPARRSHGQRAPSSRAPSSPRRVAACSLTAGGLNRRHGSTSPWALLDGLTSTPLFQESLTADGRGASIGVMEMYQSQRSVMAAQLCKWTKPP